MADVYSYYSESDDNYERYPTILDKNAVKPKVDNAFWQNGGL